MVGIHARHDQINSILVCVEKKREKKGATATRLDRASVLLTATRDSGHATKSLTEQTMFC